MNISNDFGRWPASFQEFKVAVLREVSRNPVAAIARFIFPMINKAAMYVWGLRIVFFARRVNGGCKVNKTGLMTLKNYIPQDLRTRISQQRIDPPIDHRLLIQNPPLSRPWSPIIPRVAAVGLGAIGVIALIHYLRLGDPGHSLPVHCTSLIPYPWTGLIPFNSTSVFESYMSLIPYPWTGLIPFNPTSVLEGCTSLIPYPCADLIPVCQNRLSLNFTSLVIYKALKPEPIPSMASDISSAVALYVEQCLVDHSADKTAFVIGALQEFPISNNAMTLTGALEMIFKNPIASTRILNRSVSAISYCTLLTATIAYGVFQKTIRNLSSCHLKEEESKKAVEPPIGLQLSTFVRKPVKSELNPFTKMHSLYLCLGVGLDNVIESDDSESDDGMLNLINPKQGFCLSKWVKIGKEKLNVIDHFNKLTPETMEKLKYTSSFVELLTRYRKLCLLYHPDRGGSTEAAQRLTVCWNECLINVTKICKKQLNKNEAFSSNVEHLEELGNMMQRSLICFNELFKQSKLKQGIDNASNEVESEDSSNDVSDSNKDVQLSVELEFLKSSLVSSLNQLTPDCMKPLEENTSFEALGYHYRSLEQLRSKDTAGLTELRELWKKFIVDVNDVLKVKTSDDDEQNMLDCNIEELISWDKVFSKMKEAVEDLNRSTSSEPSSDNEDSESESI